MSYIEDDAIRMGLVFKELWKTHNFLVFGNWSCCCRCGSEELNHEYNKRIKAKIDKRKRIDTIWFHNQSSMNAVKNERLPIYCGTFRRKSKTEEINKFVMESIVGQLFNLLTSHGFTYEKSGDPIGSVVIVTNFKCTLKDIKDGRLDYYHGKSLFLNGDSD